MDAKQSNALAIIQRDAANLRQIMTHETMLSLADNARGRNYDYSLFEYSLDAAHMRRSQRVHGYRARFNNIGLMRYAFNSNGITEEDVKRGVFIANAKFQDYSMNRPIVLPVEVNVMGMDKHNAVDFADMFEAFQLAVEDLNDSLNQSQDGLKLSEDMRVFARRDLLNRALNFLTMTSAEALELLESTGNYTFEDSIRYGSFSTYGFDEEKLLYIFVYAFISKLTLGVSRRAMPCLIVPRETAGDDDSFINRFVNCTRIFDESNKLINLAPINRAGREYVAVQLKSDPKSWTPSSLDALKFFAMYLYLNAEVHQFLGNDEITSIISLAILWMSSHASPNSMQTIKKHGFYRLLLRYVVDARAIPYPFRFVNVNGHRYEALPYDCFQMKRMCKLIPLGMGELFVGSDIVGLFPRGLPRDGVLPMLPVQTTKNSGNATRNLYPDTLEMERLNFR